jgi:hypothetical protein
LIWCALIGLFRSWAALEAEILVLRHQLNLLRRKSPNEYQPIRGRGQPFWVCGKDRRAIRQRAAN